MEDSFDIEFHAVFDRVSRIVDLKEAYDVNEVNQRIEQVIHYLEGTRDLLKEKREKIPKSIEYDQEQLEKLVEHNRFADRVISELLADPDGVVALTVRFGRKRAHELLLKRARERRGRLRQVTPKRISRRRWR